MALTLRASQQVIFLPTPSARRATQHIDQDDRRHVISTHALREEGDKRPVRQRRSLQISTHALREEGDLEGSRFRRRVVQFLPTPSARRATLLEKSKEENTKYFYPRPPRGGRHGGVAAVDGANGISTHALREEGDGRCLLRPGCRSNFYPRPPRGGRLGPGEGCLPLQRISTHALREEGDHLLS